MTCNPECASLDTPILDALHIMHDGKFLHLPVLDRGTFMPRILTLSVLFTSLFSSFFFLTISSTTSHYFAFF